MAKTLEEKQTLMRKRLAKRLAKSAKPEGPMVTYESCMRPAEVAEVLGVSAKTAIQIFRRRGQTIEIATGGYRSRRLVRIPKRALLQLFKEQAK